MECLNSVVRLQLYAFLEICFVAFYLYSRSLLNSAIHAAILVFTILQSSEKNMYKEV